MFYNFGPCWNKENEKKCTTFKNWKIRQQKQLPDAKKLLLTKNAFFSFGLTTFLLADELTHYGKN